MMARRLRRRARLLHQIGGALLLLALVWLFLVVTMLGGQP